MHNLISVTVQETVTSLYYPHIKQEIVTSLFFNPLFYLYWLTSRPPWYEMQYDNSDRAKTQSGKLFIFF
jgi:hypothetical protein